MQRLFESDLKTGYLDLFETEGHLIFITGFNRKATGVPMEVPLEEAADLTEALLRSFDEETRKSIIESVSNGVKVKTMV